MLMGCGNWDTSLEGKETTNNRRSIIKMTYINFIFSLCSTDSTIFWDFNYSEEVG
jgi:hypothetical protein